MKKILIVGVGSLAAVVVWGLLISLPIMLLWNWCAVPAVSGLSELGWLQAWGIYVLSNMLFKSSVSVGKE